MLYNLKSNTFLCPCMKSHTVSLRFLCSLSDTLVLCHRLVDLNIIKSMTILTQKLITSCNLMYGKLVLMLPDLYVSTVHSETNELLSSVHI